MLSIHLLTLAAAKSKRIYGTFSDFIYVYPLLRVPFFQADVAVGPVNGTIAGKSRDR